MAQFVLIAKTADIANGKMKAYTVNGRQITVAHVDGEFMAFDDTCTHAQCSLAGGYLDGHTLTCYCHGGQFDIATGEVLTPPPPSPISVYKTKVDGENILIEI